MKARRYAILPKIAIASLLALAAAYALLRLQARPADDLPFFAPAEFLVMAHRGGRSLGPENTVHTFRLAAELGVDVLEMDLRVTADNRLVVFHDATLERTTDGEGRVDRHRLTELQRLDAAFHWSPDGGATFPLRGKGIRIPTLTEVFDNFPEMSMNLEIKDLRPSVPDALCGLIRSHGMAPRVVVACFDTGILEDFRALCPQVATSAGAWEARWFYLLQRLHLQAIHSPAAHALQVPETLGGLEVVNRRFVAAAHRRNLRVHVWTVNDASAMQRLLRLGVDGIITDDPGLLLKIRQREAETGRENK